MSSEGLVGDGNIEDGVNTTVDPNPQDCHIQEQVRLNNFWYSHSSEWESTFLCSVIVDVCLRVLIYNEYITRNNSHTSSSIQLILIKTSSNQVTDVTMLRVDVEQLAKRPLNPELESFLDELLHDDNTPPTAAVITEHNYSKNQARCFSYFLHMGFFFMWELSLVVDSSCVGVIIIVLKSKSRSSSRIQASFVAHKNTFQLMFPCRCHLFRMSWSTEPPPS